jgi:hypothetical protein
VVRWRADGPVKLQVRLLMSGRDYHSLHHENPVFDFTTHRDGDALVWRPYPGVPAVTARGEFTWADDPVWYRRFHYAVEVERGMEDGEDLASPGSFSFDLPATLALRSEAPRTSPIGGLGRRATWRPMRIWPRGMAGSRSWPGIPGSPIGAGTPSSPCAAC